MTRPTCLIMMTIVAGLFFAFPGMCQTGNSETIAYDNLIEHELELLSSKIELKHSRSENLRHYGEICEKEYWFIVENWDRLSNDMLKHKVAPKPYAVHAYLVDVYRSSSR